MFLFCCACAAAVAAPGIYDVGYAAPAVAHAVAPAYAAPAYAAPAYAAPAYSVSHAVAAPAIAHTYAAPVVKAVATQVSVQMGYVICCNVANRLMSTYISVFHGCLQYQI